MTQPTPRREGRQTFTLAPSDLTFLLNECLRCFYLKVVLGRRRPPMIMPSVFTILDRQQKGYFEGRRTPDLYEGLPPGVVQYSDVAVQSVPIPVPGHDIAVQFRGSLDIALAFDCGAFGIIDLKTTEPKSRLGSFYSPQLHAYALATENPAPGFRLLRPVTVLGLLCFEPNEMVRLPDGDLAYRTKPTWVAVPRDDAAFFSLLMLVAEIVEWSVPPEPRPGCPWCPDLVARGADDVPRRRRPSPA